MLSSNELKTLKAALLKRRAELQALVKKEMGEGELDQLQGQVHDRGDEAVADLAAAMDFAIAGLDARELAEIDAALERIEAGGYGVCSDCGVKIPLARLQSQPAASRCIKCQGAVEEGRLETPRL